MKEYFRQPIVDTFDMRICIAKSVRHSVDFSQAQEADLHRIGNHFIVFCNKCYIKNIFYNGSL